MYMQAGQGLAKKSCGSLTAIRTSSIRVINFTHWIYMYRLKEKSSNVCTVFIYDVEWKNTIILAK